MMPEIEVKRLVIGGIEVFVYRSTVSLPVVVAFLLHGRKGDKAGLDGFARKLVTHSEKRALWVVVFVRSGLETRRLELTVFTGTS